MDHNTMDKSQMKECHEKVAEYLNKAAQLQKSAGIECKCGNK